MNNEKIKLDSKIKNLDWIILIHEFNPWQISENYPYSEAMQIVGHLILKSGEIDDGLEIDLLQNYAVDLMILLRKTHPHEWSQDWKNEAFLGILCGITQRSAEAFIFCKNAFQNHPSPPQSIILPYISSGRSVEHFMTDLEMNKLSEMAVEKGITYESALHMSHLETTKGNQTKAQFWKDEALKAQKNHIHTSCIVPNLLKSLLPPPEGQSLEL